MIQWMNKFYLSTSETLTKLEWTESYLTNLNWVQKSLQMVTAAMKLKDAYSLEGKL